MDSTFKDGDEMDNILSDGLYSKQQRRFEHMSDAPPGRRENVREKREPVRHETHEPKEKQGGFLSSIFQKNGGGLGLTLDQDDLIILAVLLILLTGSEETDLYLILALGYLLLDF